MRLLKYISIVILMFLYSCSTLPKQGEKGEKVKPLPWNEELKTLNLSANITSEYHDESNNAFCRIVIAGVDSLSLKITGPFEILVGRLYANKEHFDFYDAFNNQIIEGKPTAENLKRATMVPLSFKEFIRLLRCELPTNPRDFELDESYKDGNRMLFKNPSNNEYIEYALYSSENNNLLRYQRKLRNGQLILDLVYNDYEKIENFQLSKYLIFNFPEIKTKIDMKMTNINVNTDIGKPLSFKLPDGIKVYKIE